MTVDSPLAADTRLTPASDGVFEGSLSDRWNALGGIVNGGYSVAVCLQALRAVLPHPDPLTVSTFFLGRCAPGPVELRTDVAKRGRRVSTGEARMIRNGAEVVRTVASFTDLGAWNGPSAVLATLPDLPDPETAIDPMAGVRLPGVTITDRVEFRYARLPGWRRGRPSGDPSAEFWIRFTGGRDATVFDLPMLVDAAAPVVLDVAGVVGSATVELTTHVRAAPAPGWLAFRAATRYVGGGFHEEDVEIWDSRGELVAQSRQLAVVLAGSPSTSDRTDG
ncbi:thioesterase family protein [Pseudonocardia sp. TRM90224]|uniref:thioesterase family protein n=1 Tax=Pseudonocardia sp. TRM90224 TaxID=2812678 RepID=UPI001E3612ED|nr:thioesterase family protein [Pseudonocardia sp. TRM90224]